LAGFPRSTIGVILLALVGISCADPVDKAAKKRIFSPEDPPQVISSAKEKLSPEAIAGDPRVARRILEMGAAEATERLGAHQYQAKVTFEWKAGNAVTSLTETRALKAGSGGVSGDFFGHLENSREQGFEVLRVDGHVFAKDRYGKFRERKRDRGMAERTRDELYGALRDVSSLFDHRIELTPQSSISYEGRSAQRFEVSLAKEATDAAAQRLPPAQLPRLGQDETSKRRQHFFAKHRLRSLSGEVLVDQETSVVLRARLEGKMDVPGNKETAMLNLTLSSSLDHIGQAPNLKVPQDYLPDQDKPAGIAEVLDRFGIPRGGHADGGVESELPDEEP
jgi:hypothetical protein